MISRWASVVPSSRTCILVGVPQGVEQLRMLTLMTNMRILIRMIVEPNLLVIVSNGSNLPVARVHKNSGKMLIRKSKREKKILLKRSGMSSMTFLTSMIRGRHMLLKMRLRELTIKQSLKLSS